MTTSFEICTNENSRRLCAIKRPMILSQNSTAMLLPNSAALAAGCFGGLKILIEPSKQNHEQNQPEDAHSLGRMRAPPEGHSLGRTQACRSSSLLDTKGVTHIGHQRTLDSPKIDLLQHRLEDWSGSKEARTLEEIGNTIPTSCACAHWNGSINMQRY